MTADEFQPARSLEEANERLRAAEWSLAIAQERVAWINRLALEKLGPDEDEDDDEDEAEWVDAEELLARIKASVEGLDGQR